MVEVVGTAPTSAMVITKFVYRRSWKTNIINIKGITTDSITIMKLTKEQAEDGIRDSVASRGLGDVYKRQGGGYCPHVRNVYYEIRLSS